MPAPRHALLLAAGEGSRLRPLTDHVPKPLLPIDGAPVISTLVGQLAELGVGDFTVVVGPAGGPLRDHLDATRPAGAELRFVEQPVAAGTADAIQRALPALDASVPMFVAACDTVWIDGDIGRVATAHGRHRPLVTMAARRWPLAQLPHRSCLSLDEHGRVLRVIEKPSADEVTSALSGSPLYVFEPGFWTFVDAVEPSVNGRSELATALQAAIDAGHAVLSCEVGPTRDLTRPNDLLRFNFPYLEALLPELPTGS